MNVGLTLLACVLRFHFLHFSDQGTNLLAAWMPYPHYPPLFAINCSTQDQGRASRFRLTIIHLCHTRYRRRSDLHELLLSPQGHCFYCSCARYEPFSSAWLRQTSGDYALAPENKNIYKSSSSKCRFVTIFGCFALPNPNPALTSC